MLGLVAKPVIQAIEGLEFLEWESSKRDISAQLVLLNKDFCFFVNWLKEVGMLQSHHQNGNGKSG